MSASIRRMSARLATTMSPGFSARLATWRRSRSIVTLSASSAGVSAVPLAPALTSVRILVSFAMTSAVVAATVRSCRMSPSSIASARSVARSAGRLLRALLYGVRNSAFPVAA